MTTGKDEADQAFLGIFEDEEASIAGDIVQVSTHLWAVHGVIPVDGDVLLAEFGTYDQARDALDQALTQRAPVSPDWGVPRRRSRPEARDGAPGRIPPTKARPS